jgi:peptidylprolyl isomerase
VKEVSVRSTSRFPRVPALLGAAALLTASLAGCSATPGFGGCAPVLTGGDASSIVTASGDVGDKPTIDFPMPLVASSTPEATVLTTGDGETVRDGEQVDYELTVLDGASGAIAGQSNYDGSQFNRIGAKSTSSAIQQALVCATVGSRIAVVSTWEDTRDAFGPGAASAFEDTATLVLVLDVVHSYLGKADGINQLPRDGAPTVATEVDGTPGITVPLQDPPTETYSSAIKAGDGATVRADDMVVLHYRVFTWPEGGGTDPGLSTNTWEQGIAPSVAMTVSDTGALPAGVVNALVGQKIGSQILVVVPPGDDGFVFNDTTADTIPLGVTPTSTTIFVVDLLGIQK